MTRTSAPPRSSDTDIEKNELFPEKVMIATTDLYRAGLATSLGSALEYTRHLAQAMMQKTLQATFPFGCRRWTGR